MDQTLLLLFLMNLCSLSFAVSDKNYVFHFINEAKTWEDAQKYCRKHYSDLATVKDLKDLKNLEDLMEAAAGAWIGLNNLENDRTWHWSRPGERKFSVSEVEGEWKNGEPNDHGGRENCVFINKDSKWSDGDCGADLCFICYNDSSGEYFSDTRVNWITAQHKCRERNSELISGLDRINHINNWGSGCDRWWIGLFRDTWSWSDGSHSSFRNWRPDEDIMNKEYDHDDEGCVKLGPQGTFIRDDCNHDNPFICYNDLFILVKEKKTFEEALVHCREHHRDLAWFIDHQHLKQMAQVRAKMADTEQVWVGLHYACFLEAWFWVNGHYVSDTNENWKSTEGSECSKGGAMERGGEWVKRDLGEGNNFICVCRGSSCK